MRRLTQFYASPSWRLYLDYTAVNDDYRVLQFTPPGSACSVIFGKIVSTSLPGSARGVHLIVFDLEATRAELIGRGLEVSYAFHDMVGYCKR